MDRMYYARWWDDEGNLMESEPIIFPPDATLTENEIREEANELFGDPSLDPATLRLTLDGPFDIHAGP